MSQSTSPSRNRVYGTALICRTWKLSRATVYRHGIVARPDPDLDKPSLRRGPVGACADQDLLVHIKAEIEASPFQGEGYRNIWARLRYKGVRTAARPVRRVMKENALLAPHRPWVRPDHPQDGTIVTERVDDVRGTDMPQTLIARSPIRYWRGRVLFTLVTAAIYTAVYDNPLFPHIPCSRQNPEFLRINDPEIIGNGAAELRPFSGNAFA